MLIMNTKQKGRQLVLEVIRILKDEYGLECHEVAGSGAGNREKGDIRAPALDLVIEAKKHKRVSISEWAKQSEREGLGYNKTALVWQIPNTPHIRADIDICYFAELLKRAREPKIKEIDKRMSWDIKMLIQSAKKVVKQLEK